MGRSTRPKDSKGQDEKHRETGTIESPGNKIRVVLEDPWVMVPEVELDEEAADDPTEENAGLALVVRDEARILNELGHVDLRDVKAANLWNKLGVFARQRRGFSR
jgi:hypothetical protein